MGARGAVSDQMFAFPFKGKDAALTVIFHLDLPIFHFGHLPVIYSLPYVFICFQVKHF